MGTVTGGPQPLTGGQGLANKQRRCLVTRLHGSGDQQQSQRTREQPPSADVLSQVTRTVLVSVHPSLSTHARGELALLGLGLGAPQEG